MNRKDLKDILWKLAAPLIVAFVLLLGFVGVLLLALGGDD